MNELVKYHNDMSSVSFPGFSPMQHNILAAICYECKDKGSKRTSILIERLKELSGYDSKDNDRFIAYLDDLSDRVFDLEYRETKGDGGFKKFVLFTYFETDKLKTKDASLIVGVSEDFEYILNNNNGALPMLRAGYTTFELEQHNSLRSTYSKQAFRLLKRFKRTGWWQVSVEEFRRLLSVPPSYEMKEVNRRVVKPIMEELPSFFENLELERIKGGSTGKKIVAFKFTFKPQLERKIWTDRDVFETKYSCPECGKTLYSIWTDSGEEFFGHKDGWKLDAPCRKTYSSLQEIARELEVRGLEVPQEMEEKNSNELAGGIAERAGFTCKECGRPLYILHNRKGEIFYGHVDGWKADAPCRRTYGSIAEIRGYSETPTREDHADYELVDARDTEEIGRIKGREGSIYGTFETKEN